MQFTAVAGAQYFRDDMEDIEFVEHLPGDEHIPHNA